MGLSGDGKPAGFCPTCFEQGVTGCGWMVMQSHLKRNLMKTEVLYLSCGGVGSGIQLLTLDGALLVPLPSIRSLGVTLDVSLTMGASLLPGQHFTISAWLGN